MDTLKEFEKEFSSHLDAGIIIVDDVEMVLIDTPKPGMPFKALGSYGYRSKESVGYLEQHFILSKAGKLSGDIKINELDMVIALCKSLENIKGVVIENVMLPRTFGFSGNKHSYKQTMSIIKNK